jgi:uncharacterized protein YdhG (YjbR/CyaY superfamily)
MREDEMWKCPKCGKSFKNVNQSHYCGEKPGTIDDYIESQDEAFRPCLNAVRDTLREALPEVKERISWSMPTYWDKHNIIHFAASRKHIGLYPGPEAVEHFQGKLDELGLKSAKGTIRIPYQENPGDLPLDLIREIAIWCVQTGNHA